MALGAMTVDYECLFIYYIHIYIHNVIRDDGLPIPVTPSFTLNAIVRQVYNWMVNILALYNVQPAITGSRINHEIDVYHDVSCLVLLGTPPPRIQ